MDVGPAAIRARAGDATEEERHRLWPALTAGYDYFDAYQACIPRRIPVVVLSAD